MLIESQAAGAEFIAGDRRCNQPLGDVGDRQRDGPGMALRRDWDGRRTEETRRLDFDVLALRFRLILEAARSAIIPLGLTRMPGIWHERL